MSQQPDLIVGTCSFCGYLGYCELRQRPRRFRVQICIACDAEQVLPKPMARAAHSIQRAIASDPMLPITPLRPPATQPRPPARVASATTGRRQQPVARAGGAR